MRKPPATADRDAGRIVCLLGLVVALFVCALPAAAVADSRLLGVSCTSTPKACLGVGSTVNGSGTTVTLGESWNGTSWSVQETLNPSGAKSSKLRGVSGCGGCSTRAVGSFVNSSGVEEMLVEGQHGTEWKIEEVTNPSGAKASRLNGVVCGPIVICNAVGDYVNSSGVEVTLAEFSGTEKWTIKKTQNPSGAKASALSGIACHPISVCTAVGHYKNSSGVEVTLAEHRTPEEEWSIQETPNPKEAKASSLSGVSCNENACTATGRYVNSAGTELTLAESWNGKAWSLQETPNPKDAKVSSLSSVSCATAEACTAVGSYTHGASITATLAESWNGKAWSLQEPPNPKEAKASNFTGVSCTSAEACLAVGSSTSGLGTEILSETWNGKEWKI